MKLRGIDFGNVLGASGVQGFFGEGYWPHWIFKWLGLNFNGSTFTAKTTTFQSQEGNMPLTEKYTPKHWFPSCILVKFWRGLILNAVGLSNPGLLRLLITGKWQKITKPFFISLMSLAKTKAERLEEFEGMIEILRKFMTEFSAPIGLQINLSCPNTGHNPRELIHETAEVLQIASSLGVPLMPKFSIASAPIEAVMELNDDPNCDAICVSNTIPFGWQPGLVSEVLGIGWEDTWGSRVSPLAYLGGGGLSGPAIRPFVLDWIQRLRDEGFTKPINGGGGIFTHEDIYEYFTVGASSIFLGSVATLRPWRVKSLIRYANTLDWNVHV